MNNCKTILPKKCCKDILTATIAGNENINNVTFPENPCTGSLYIVKFDDSLVIYKYQNGVWSKIIEQEDSPITTFIQEDSPYEGQYPNLDGVTEGDTNITQYSDGTLVGYTWDGSVWEDSFEKNGIEKRITLNTATPTFIPLDVNNPTTAEVETWITTNLTFLELNNGTQVVYFVNGDGGSEDNPDYIWTLNDGQATLSNKRVFNTKTVYVDAGSGSDVTGRRGYREFPFKTLNAAIAAIQDGDLLEIFPGEYVNITPWTKHFNVYAHDGSSVQMVSRLTDLILFDNLLELNWRFDKVWATTHIDLMSTKNKAINIYINKAENVAFYPRLTKGKLTILNGKNVTIGHTSNTDFTDPVSHLIVDNLDIDSSTSLGQGVGSFDTFVNNEVFVYEINNLNYNILTTDNRRIFAYDETPNARQGVYHSLTIKNSKFFKGTTTQLSADPGYGSTYEHYSIFFLRHSVLNNSKYIFNLGNVTTDLNGFNDQTASTGTEVIIDLKGRFTKGVPYICHSNNNLTHVKVNLDVIVEDNYSIYLSNNGDRVIEISGKIVSNSAKTPIKIVGISNNIILKDLTIIANNATYAIESSVPTNVIVNNVTSNILTTDVNTTEVGQSIIRDVNYK